MQTLIPRPGRIVWLAALVLCAGCASGKKAVTLRFHEQVDTSLPGAYAHMVEIPRANLRLQIAVAATLTERDVEKATLIETAGGAAVMLKFDVHGAIKLDEMTTRGRGQRVVVFLDGKPIAAVLIGQRLTTGQFLLEGDFTDEQARQLVDSLNKGSRKQQHQSFDNAGD